LSIMFSKFLKEEREDSFLIAIIEWNENPLSWVNALNFYSNLVTISVFREAQLQELKFNDLPVSLRIDFQINHNSSQNVDFKCVYFDEKNETFQNYQVVLNKVDFETSIASCEANHLASFGVIGEIESSDIVFLTNSVSHKFRNFQQHIIYRSFRFMFFNNFSRIIAVYNIGSFN
jgi:hypothetical protein